ncbi:iron-containing alcohol dehydrogenase [Desulfococcaceae bacterium HSG8]|nr:iron-containing alcohol dehydrogenase [Desulfococcaceae bacterium HSG8]
MLPEFFEFYNPTKVVYGIGIARDFRAELDVLGIEKYFIISDQVINDLGLVEKVKKGLIDAGIRITGIFLDVPPNSEIKTVSSCAEQAKASGAEGLIAIGGGSVIDTAKATNILICKGGDLIEDHSGVHLLTEPLMPLVVIPTTAGTGSEVTTVSVIYDEENKVKIPFTDKFLLPDIAVLDPEMTSSMPPKITASTGMDALTHAIEAFVGVQWSPFSDIFAIGATELIFKNIIKATENGDDLEARGAMLVASNMAGTAFSHSMVGCVHAMAHAVGGLYHVPHGVANAILLPHGMEYNFEEIKEKLMRLAPAVNEDISGCSADDAARKIIAAIRKLTGRLNEMGALSLRLRDAGVPEDGLPEAADAAVADGSSWFNPREVVAEEILTHMKNAY